ncbi:MAG TPA: fumarylacetoacetate hydrolase family protein [Thermoleophilaceae bacterium]|nr:fumarylacetoacetate hydrolase family protein [Thermoleophilaceae bacterium]
MPGEPDPRVKAGLERQLEEWRRLQGEGARRLGWKIGFNAPKARAALGLDAPVIGYLTSATEITDGGSHSLAGARKPLVEVEVAIELRRDVGADAEVDEALAAIESLGPAVELIDMPGMPEDLEDALAGNVFHRGVAFGPHRQDAAVGGIVATIAVSGEERESAAAEVDLADTIRLVADLLAICGERLQAGDRIIAGTLTPPVPVSAGDEVRAELGPLGSVELSLTG